jgi:hypothetical protein
MNKLVAITAIVVGLLAAGLSAQAGIFSHVLGAKSSPSFAERWSPVDQALRSGTFVVQSDASVF